jgi:hypothetical protein
MSKPLNISDKLPWRYAWYFIALLVFAFGHLPSAISSVYLPYLFRPITLLLRFLIGGIPFAIGEFVYLIISILLIINLLKWLRTNKRKFKTTLFWKHQGVKCLNTFTVIYVLFEMIWGLNYQKSNPSADFQLQVPLAYSEAQMDSLSLSLITDLNLTRSKMSDFDPNLMNFDTILSQNRVEFANNAQKRPFIKYQNPSLKASIFPSWGDYFGYTAFYQPLTGEAIVRGDLPKLTLPFTMSHEIAHQLGYASEDQANFIAYVIGIESDQPVFNYATQLQLFTYAQYAHLDLIAKRGDFEMYKQVVERNRKLLSAQVLEDRRVIKAFFRKKQDLQIKGTEEMYNQFLIWNQQTKGIESYNDVLLWVLAYRAKKIPSFH